MRQKHSKLIRDRIPEIIRQAGREYEVKTMSQSEYYQALLDKLIEEAKEAAEAKPDNLVEELADIYEVIDGILTNLKIDKDLVLARQEQKRKEKGGFAKKIRLLWTK
ncbi:nucleoside triphosphate pyrophosphohydrolase [Pleurocapsa sp. PCC 7319]|uniref:nucleoside triphosphate pyrophosphohydrolase n=1 Tax=Pleurocapsa sp. PCC 7319 TaxID=118161 RepID=UPI0003476080|nr:nucleoside triphosphate pyrophosphohydrolase [Pleurocapsa sp. PCC 7319]